MNTSSQKLALIAALKKMHAEKPEIGYLRELHDFGDNKLIIIMYDTNFTNAELQKVIARLIDYLVRIRVLTLVGLCGNSGDIDTGWLKRIANSNLGPALINGLLDQGKLKGAEYCHIYSTTPFVLFGPEDSKLYEHGVSLWVQLLPLRNFIEEDKRAERIVIARTMPKWEPFFDMFQNFLDNERQRSKVILENMLSKMEGMAVATAAIVCNGNLPMHLSDKLTKKMISYAILDPTKEAPDNRQLHEHMLLQQLKITSEDRGVNP